MRHRCLMSSATLSRVRLCISSSSRSLPLSLKVSNLNETCREGSFQGHAIPSKCQGHVHVLCHVILKAKCFDIHVSLCSDYTPIFPSNRETDNKDMCETKDPGHLLLILSVLHLSWHLFILMFISQCTSTKLGLQVNIYMYKDYSKSTDMT